MHEAVAGMMARYNCQTSADYTNALREIMQEIVLLGLWRSKFFEKAAFYGAGQCHVLQPPVMRRLRRRGPYLG